MGGRPMNIYEKIIAMRRDIQMEVVRSPGVDLLIHVKGVMYKYEVASVLKMTAPERYEIKLVNAASKEPDFVLFTVYADSLRKAYELIFEVVII